MKKSLIHILGLILVFVLFQGFRELTKKEKEKPAPSQLPMEPKISAFYEEGWDGIYAGSLARLKEVKGKVDVVSPVWLSLKADGEVNRDKTDAQAVDFFVQNQLEFMVLVTAGSGWNGSSILARKTTVSML